MVSKHTSQCRNCTRESQAEINGVLWTRRSQLFFSFFENYKRLKKKVARPDPGCRKVFSKGTLELIAPEGGKIRALTHILKIGRPFCSWCQSASRVGFAGLTVKPMDLNSLKSCNIADRIPSSTAADDSPISFAISRLVIPEKNASSIIRCCTGGIAFSTARTSRRCSVMLTEEVDLVFAVLFRNVSLLVVSCLQRRSMARRCAMSISQVRGLSFCLPNWAALSRTSS